MSTLVIILTFYGFDLQRFYLYSNTDTSSPQRISFNFDLVDFILNLNLQLIIQGYITPLRPLKVLTFGNLFLVRYQRYTVAVNALQHPYMAFDPSKSQYKITPYHKNQPKITPQHLRVPRTSNIYMRIFTRNIPYLAF